MITLKSFSLFRGVSYVRSCFIRHGICHLERNFSNVERQTSLMCEQLSSRGLISVSGLDASSFLQGLITNDIKQFVAQPNVSRYSSIFALLLNHQGRVLYDVIIYKVNNADASPSTPTSYLVECDAQIEAELCKHLNTFNIRKKIDVKSITENHKVWSLFPRLQAPSEHVTPPENNKCDLDLRIVGSNDVLVWTLDPRLQMSPFTRLLLKGDTKPRDVLTQVKFDDSIPDPTSTFDYTSMRYRYGIGEGILDLPPGNCFPLECNGDYMNGVSFHKGCYIGQELTSRTHHTGVVRKRLMPLVFDKILPKVIDEAELLVKNEQGRAIGKVKGHQGRFAIGLIRIEQACTSQPDKKLFCELTKTIRIGVRVHKPFWWPPEITKDNLVIRNL